MNVIIDRLPTRWHRLVLGRHGDWAAVVACMVLSVPLAMARLEMGMIIRQVDWSLGIALAVSFVLLLRRSQPVTCVVIGLGALLASGVSVPLLFAAYAVGRRRTARGSALVVVLLFTVLPASGPFVYPGPTLIYSIGEAAIRALAACACLLGGVSVRLSHTALDAERLRGQLADLRARQRIEHEVVTVRQDVAAELHDYVGHAITAIVLEAGVLDGSTRDQSVKHAAVRIADHGKAVLRQTQEVVHRLRGDTDATGPVHGLTDVPDLVASFRKAGVTVTLTEQDTVGIVDELPGSAVYRLVQEGLTNAAKHAQGAAIHITVHIGQGALSTEVRNGPAGTSQPHPGLPSSGLGLIGLRERFRVLGGTVEATTLADGGFRLRGTLPTP